MRRLLQIMTLFIATSFLISCGSDSVSNDSESFGIKPAESSEAAAFHSVTDSDVRATLAQVRRATANYHNVEKAKEDGYEQVSGFVPGMGYHYLKGALMDNEVIPTQPEALVYVDNPADISKRRLVAVEYLIPDVLVGQQSELDGKFPGVDADSWHHEEEIGAWTLHAWIWYPNPEGIFHSTNPRIGAGN